MSKFPKTHYVYLYRRADGTPLYVGKGWGKRAWQHVWVAGTNPEAHANRHLSHTLAKMIREGHDPQPEIVAQFDTHEEALAEEMRLIAEIGRVGTGNGHLVNLTDGGEGAAGRGLSIELDGREFVTIREACNHYDLNEGTIRNRMNVLGWTVRQAFDLDSSPEHPASYGKEITINDTTFDSIRAACRHFNLTIGAVYKRFEYGWTPEQVFELDAPPKVHGPNARPITVCDIIYPSRNEACRQLGLKPDTVKARLTVRGWTVEQAFELEAPPNRYGGKGNPVTVGGQTFDSLAAAARAYAQHPDTVAWRMKQGQSLEEALRRQSKKEIKVQGQTFRSMEAAATHFGLNGPTVRCRIRRGWLVETALTTPLNSNGRAGSGGREMVIRGVTYPAFSAACKTHGVSDSLAYWRLRRGWSLEDAVTTPKEDRSNTFRGETYPSFTALCRAHGLSRTTVEQRTKRGWSLERALTTEKIKPTKSAKIAGQTENETNPRRQ